MPLTLDTFKLHRLTIYSFNTESRRGVPATFVVPFNPNSLRLSYRNIYSAPKGINAVGGRGTFAGSVHDNLNIDLVFDGSGVADDGVLALPRLTTVTKTVEDFLTKCFAVNGQTHEPGYLRLNWGDGPLKNFDCRLVKADITYTSFGRDGSPLRAKVAAEFVKYVAPAKVSRELALASPDVSHSLTVRSGDTLPLLCQTVYGSPNYHAAVARANDLDSLRHIEPGTQLMLPPLAS